MTRLIFLALIGIATYQISHSWIAVIAVCALTWFGSNYVQGFIRGFIIGFADSFMKTRYGIEPLQEVRE